MKFLPLIFPVSYVCPTGDFELCQRLMDKIRCEGAKEATVGDISTKLFHIRINLIDT